MAINWFNKTVDEVESTLKTNAENGLTAEEAKKRQEEYGLNELKAKKKKSLFVKFLEQFKDFMIIILIISAIISGVVGVAQGEGFTDTIIILVVVVVNAIIGVAQENKAEKSLEALQKLSSHVAKVVRDGKLQVIQSKELVPGDIVILETGDYVPADLRIIEAVNLKSQESALTGESVPVEKMAAKIEDEKIGIGDRVNMLFSSSLITYARGKAVVVETGMNTEVGKIADIINTAEEQGTPLQQKLNKLGKTLGIVALAICAVIFVVGLLYGKEPIHMFMTAVSLAVAAIPEGLPAVFTIVLAIGVQRMVKRNAIVKKLPAVETLGSASVICSDKTGTLTQNKMTVEKVFCDGNLVNLEESADMIDIQKLVYASMLCNDTKISEDDKLTGDPTETALVDMAFKLDFDPSVYGMFPRVAEIPFDSDRKLMTTVHEENGNYVVYTKGGVDELLANCSSYILEGDIKTDLEEYKEIIRRYNMEMAQNALRVLAMAYKVLDHKPTAEEIKELESNLTYIGMVGMIDPPRLEVKDAVQECKEAGIKTVMITGDHKITAIAIAKSLGILENDDEAITGTELEEMSDEELIRNVRKYSVYARVSPEHKVRIVKAWQANGETVAMTGDGVNDVLALKDADCSIAMASGSEAAAQASQIVLLESDFSCMPQVVLEGRRVVNNIQRSASLFLVKNIFSFLLSLFSVVFMFTYPLEPSQVSLISMFTIGIPAFFLALEPNKNIIKGHFLTNVFLKALPAALTDALAVGALVIFGKTFGVGEQDISTAATMLLAIVGFMILYKISAPMNKLRAGILGGCIAGLLFCSIYLNQLFAITGMTTKCIMLFVVFAIATEPVLRYLTILLGKGRFYYRRLRGKAPLEEEA